MNKKDKAMELYCSKSLSLANISTELSVPMSTLYRWKKADKWDEHVVVSSLTTALNIEKALSDAIKQAVETGTLSDPKTADAISKLQKVINQLKPKQQILANIYLFLTDLSDYATGCGDSYFSFALAEHLTQIGEFMRNRHGGGNG